MEAQISHYQNKLAFEIDPADLFESINNEGKIVIIDARKKEGYQIEHIPGAINIPHREMNEHSTGHLNKDFLFITYCDGIGCNASTKGALRMAELGFTVKELIGGLDWWQRDGYSTEGTIAISVNTTVSCNC